MTQGIKNRAVILSLTCKHAPGKISPVNNENKEAISECQVKEQSLFSVAVKHNVVPFVNVVYTGVLECCQEQHKADLGCYFQEVMLVTVLQE